MMMLAWLLSAAILVSGGNDQKATPPDQIAQRAAAAMGAYARHDCSAALAQAKPLLDVRDIDAKLLSSLYDIVISCEMQAGHTNKGADLARRATPLAESSNFAWRTRLEIALNVQDDEAAVATIEAMTQGHRQALDSVPVIWLWRLKNRLDYAGKKALEERLLKIMADAAYQPDDVDALVDDSAGMARVEYAAMLASRGETDAARAEIGAIESLDAALEAEFTPELRVLLPRPIDFRDVVERELARHRALMAAHPDSLDAIKDTGLDLLRLGRSAEAISVLESERDRVNQPHAFFDTAEAASWWWNNLAMAYRQEGRYDDAIAAYRSGMEVGENGQPNISEYINLADTDLRFGHNDRALSDLADFEARSGSASPYGKMQVRWIRGCAMARQGDVRGATAIYADAVAHERDDPRTVTELALCLGDEGAAALSYIKRLADPAMHRGAMLDLADYDPPDPKSPVEFNAKLRDEVRSRLDVTGALARYGGALVIHLQSVDIY